MGEKIVVLIFLAETIVDLRLEVSVIVMRTAFDLSAFRIKAGFVKDIRMAFPIEKIVGKLAEDKGLELALRKSGSTFIGIDTIRSFH